LFNSSLHLLNIDFPILGLALLFKFYLFKRHYLSLKSIDKRHLNKRHLNKLRSNKRHLNTCVIYLLKFCYNRVVQINVFIHFKLTSFKTCCCFQALTIARNGPITIALYSARFENCANGMEQLQVKQKNERIANIIYFYEQFMNNFK
jgi:hypothetical protein